VIPVGYLGYTFYLQELLLRLLQRNDPHPGLFDAYAVALGRLADMSVSPESTLRVFESALLHELGYGLVLDHDVGEGNPIDEEQSYTYCLEHGPVCGVAEEPGIPVSGAALRALASGHLRERAHLREIKQLMRATLSLYLGERPLKSRELFYDSGTDRPQQPAEEGSADEGSER
jgi:DNA repair protein RecO (recombination protein O)